MDFLSQLTTTLVGIVFSVFLWILKDFKKEIKSLVNSVNHVNEKLTKFIAVVERHETEISKLKKGGNKKWI